MNDLPNHREGNMKKGRNFLEKTNVLKTLKSNLLKEVKIYGHLSKISSL